MRFKIVFKMALFISVFTLSSLATASINLDLKTLVNRAEQIATDGNMNSEACSDQLTQYYKELSQINPADADLNQATLDFKDLTLSLFYTRLEMRNRLKDIAAREGITSNSVQKCVSAMRDVFRLHRYLEDYLGELILKPKRYEDKKDEKTNNPLQGDAPHTMMAPNVEKWTVRSGDIIISRGNAFTSAAIARIGQVDAQFSHLAFIYILGADSEKELSVDEAVQNPNVLVLEAHIEVGSTIRTFADYLKDGNARAALFRYPDFRLAHEAARQSYSHIADHLMKSRAQHPGWDKKDPTHNVPYDFKMRDRKSVV